VIENLREEGYFGLPLAGADVLKDRQPGGSDKEHCQENQNTDALKRFHQFG
jgi:hypothetical protein